jgi:hypothetical protein
VPLDPDRACLNAPGSDRYFVFQNIERPQYFVLEVPGPTDTLSFKVSRDPSLSPSLPVSRRPSVARSSQPLQTLKQIRCTRLGTHPLSRKDTSLRSKVNCQRTHFAQGLPPRRRPPAETTRGSIGRGVRRTFGPPALRSPSFSVIELGLTRLELVTSRLSGARSNHLSYRPGKKKGKGRKTLLLDDRSLTK